MGSRKRCQILMKLLYKCFMIQLIVCIEKWSLVQIHEYKVELEQITNIRKSNKNNYT